LGLLLLPLLRHHIEVLISHTLLLIFMTVKMGITLREGSHRAPRHLGQQG
jgi:hypothetical protein